MAETTQKITAPIAIPIDLSALPTSATFVLGRESDQVDNSVNNYIDALVNIDGIVSHAATVPVVGQRIDFYVWGSDTSGSAIDVLDGVDSAETLGHLSVLNSLKFGGSASVTEATAGLTYYIQPFSIAALFGGIMPNFWGIFAAHNHAGALAASQTGKVSYQGITFESV